MLYAVAGLVHITRVGSVADISPLSLSSGSITNNIFFTPFGGSLPAMSIMIANILSCWYESLIAKYALETSSGALGDAKKNCIT